MYKAVVARNPIIDVASATIASDVSDWYRVIKPEMLGLLIFIIHLLGILLKPDQYLHKRMNQILMILSKCVKFLQFNVYIK